MKVDREEQVDYITKYLLTSFGPMDLNYWDKELFQQKVYSIWAIQKLLYKIDHEPRVPVMFILERFIDTMNRYSLKNEKTSLMFSIAYDTAMDIYDKLLLLNEGVYIERI